MCDKLLYIWGVINVLVRLEHWVFWGIQYVLKLKKWIEATLKHAILRSVSVISEATEDHIWKVNGCDPAYVYGKVSVLAMLTGLERNILGE